MRQCRSSHFNYNSHNFCPSADRANRCRCNKSNYTRQNIIKQEKCIRTSHFLHKKTHKRCSPAEISVSELTMAKIFSDSKDIRPFLSVFYIIKKPPYRRRDRFPAAESQPYVTVSGNIKLLCDNSVRHSPENQLRQNTYAQPAFNH